MNGVPVSAMIISMVIGAMAGGAVFAALFLTLRASMRRRLKPAPTPDSAALCIDDIWQAWRQGVLAPAAAFADEAPATTLDDAALSAVRNELLETESRVLEQPQPLTALREEIMGAIDRRMLLLEGLAAHSETGEKPAADAIHQDLAANTLRTRLLRYYGAAKFGDRAEHDWYDVYRQAAQLKRKSFRNFIAQPAADPGNGRYRTAVIVGEHIRQQLLATPPGTSFIDRPAETENNHG
ncbi:MAG TPA: hypothetical protein VFM97_08930 [Gammaproteobacteria bacterium]|nr:hypothetical protein [Gammaproteobacteria bacterium]